MSATGESFAVDRALETVAAWSLRIHPAGGSLHAWCLASARALVAGGVVPVWPGSYERMGTSRLEIIRGLLEEEGLTLGDGLVGRAAS